MAEEVPRSAALGSAMREVDSRSCHVARASAEEDHHVQEVALDAPMDGDTRLAGGRMDAERTLSAEAAFRRDQVHNVAEEVHTHSSSAADA